MGAGQQSRWWRHRSRAHPLSRVAFARVHMGPIAAIVIVAPAMVVLSLEEPPRRKSPSFRAHLRQVAHELRETCLSPKNAFGFLLLLAPGAGALVWLITCHFARLRCQWFGGRLDQWGGRRDHHGAGMPRRRMDSGQF
jgi:hypothetical protein